MCVYILVEEWHEYCGDNHPLLDGLKMEFMLGTITGHKNL